MAELLTYLTVSTPFSYEIPKIKGSKFIWYLFPVDQKEQADAILIQHRKTYHDATHHCYAYRIGTQVHQDLFWITYIDPQLKKSSDDGEPANTAGKPILSVIEWEKLHNILLIVTRYFWGTMLGVGGLIQAYTETAKQTIANAPLITAEIMTTIDIIYPYEKTAQISYLINKYKIKILAEERWELVKQTIQINSAFTEILKEELKNYINS